MLTASLLHYNLLLGTVRLKEALVINDDMQKEVAHLDF